MKYFNLLFIIPLILSGITLTAGEVVKSFELAQQTGQKSKAKKKFTWKKYRAICGSDNKSRKKNFEKIKGRQIFWMGKVAEVTKDMALTENRTWCEKVIRVKMDPSDSLLADIKLKIPKGKKDKMERFEKGQYVAFKGKIMYLGTKLSDHVVEVAKFKRVKPKSKKRSSK